MVRLNNPELQQFLEDEVRTGRFASIDDAIEAAVHRMKCEGDYVGPLDDDLEERLQRAEEQVARGEVMTVAELREKLGRGLGIKL